MVIAAVRILIIFICAFLVAVSFTPALIKFLKKRNANKQIRSSETSPIYSKLHSGKAGTPTMGGIIIWGTVIVLAILFYVLGFLFDGFLGGLNFIDRAQTYLPLMAMLIAAILGLMDDILGVLKIGPAGGGLGVKHKLVLYAVISALGAWWFYAPYNLDWHVIKVPFLGVYDIGFWYVPIFMFIIVASAFSSNETDGLDGLLGGVALFAYGALTAVAFALGRYELAAMGGAIAGATLAFLWFNIYPARFFMGDTGSMALGITLGVMTMLTNTIFLLPFFAIILVIESLSVVAQVLSRKLFSKKIFLSAPIHHHFEAVGWPESQVTMRFWIISIVFVSLGLIIFSLDRFL